MKNEVATMSTYGCKCTICAYHFVVVRLTDRVVDPVVGPAQGRRLLDQPLLDQLLFAADARAATRRASAPGVGPRALLFAGHDQPDQPVETERGQHGGQTLHGRGQQQSQVGQHRGPVGLQLIGRQGFVLRLQKHAESFLYHTG